MRAGAVVLGSIVTVLALAGVGALYAIGGSGGAEGQYRATLVLLREIQQLSSNWSIETARVKSDPSADFDSLAAFVPRMTRLKRSLAATVRQIPDLPDRLAGDLRAYPSAVDAKEERIERFKTDYAVVRNSTNYFPLAAASLVQQAEAAADGALARTVAAVAGDMSTYLMTPTDTGRSRLAAALQALRAASVEHPLPVANALVDFVSHGEILIDRKEAAEELFREATSNDLSVRTNRLAGRLEQELKRREIATEWSRRGMVAVVGVLALFWIALLLLRRPRGGPPAFDEAFQPSAEPAPTPEAAVDSAVRFESSWSEAPAKPKAKARGRDSTLALGGGEAEFVEDERPSRGGTPSAAGGDEEIVFVEDEDPSFAAVVGETVSVGGEERRPAGEGGAPARSEAPSAAAAEGGEAAPVEDDAASRKDGPSVSAAAPAVEDEAASAAAPAVGEATFVGGEERRPAGEDEAPIRAAASTVPGGEAVSAEDDAASGEDGPSAGSSAAAPAEDELLAIRELLRRIEDESPAAAEGKPPPPASVLRTEIPPAGGEAAAPAGEVAAAGEEAPAAAGEAPWPPVEAPAPLVPEGRPVSRADSLQETRNRIREVLGAGAAIVDLRVRTGPDAGAGEASPAASDLRRIADLLERLASSPQLPGGGADRGRVDVNACIDEAVRSTRAEAAAAVERDLHPVPRVSGSTADVRLLLAEIVENSVLAVQAQHERPPAIRIHTSRRNDEVLVTIIDNGVGIPADAREAVFHPFHTSRHGSIGVGLTLARCLAEKHDGAVRINSSLHHGTVARITLPVEPPAS